MQTRQQFQGILEQKNNPKISIIIGPRQVGKTTILKELHKRLGGIFIDIDIFSQYEQISSYENFLNTIKLKGYKAEQKEFFFVFLDEFQRYSDLSQILKNIYDHHPNIKIYASGSSSLTIKNQIQESLAGRKQITYLYPLSFREYLFFQNKSKLWSEIQNLTGLESSDYFKLIPELLPLWSEFVVFGGYPEVVLTENKEEKKQVLENIFDLYIKKDLVEYLKIEKIRNAKLLIQKLAINHGGMVNFTELAQGANLDVKTAQNYTEILKETFLINIVRPFFKNKNKEISKMPKIYFLDNGVRNYFYYNFNDLDRRDDAGVLFESYYLGELIKNTENPENLKYYRTKNKVEVDLILDRVSEILPFELKYKTRIRANDLLGLKSFMREYKLSRGYLVNNKQLGKVDQIQMLDCFNLPLRNKN